MYITQVNVMSFHMISLDYVVIWIGSLCLLIILIAYFLLCFCECVFVCERERAFIHSSPSMMYYVLCCLVIVINKIDLFVIILQIIMLIYLIVSYLPPPRAFKFCICICF